MTTRHQVIGQEVHNFIKKWAPDRYAEMFRDLERLIDGSIRGAEIGTNIFVEPERR